MLCPDVGQHIQGSGGSWRGSRSTWSTPGAAQEVKEGNKKLRPQPTASYNFLWVSSVMDLNSPWFVLLSRRVLCSHSPFIIRQLSNYPWGNWDTKTAGVFCWKMDSQVYLSLLGLGNIFYFWTPVWKHMHSNSTCIYQSLCTDNAIAKFSSPHWQSIQESPCPCYSDITLL